MLDDDISGTQDLMSQGVSGNPSSAASFPAFRKLPSLSEDKEGDNSSWEGWRIQSREDHEIIKDNA